MKKKHFLIGLSVIFSVLLSSCNEESVELNPQTAYMQYEGFSGEIGKAGGKIQVNDPASQINGTIIEIPENALSQTVNIIIHAIESPGIFESTEGDIAIELEPEEQEFNIPVRITLPYTSSISESDVKVFYYNSSDTIIAQQEILHVNTTDNTVEFETDHFSIYFSTGNGLDYIYGILNWYGKVAFLINMKDCLFSLQKLFSTEKLSHDDLFENSNPGAKGIHSTFKIELQSEAVGYNFYYPKKVFLYRNVYYYENEYDGNLFIRESYSGHHRDTSIIYNIPESDLQNFLEGGYCYFITDLDITDLDSECKNYLKFSYHFGEIFNILNPCGGTSNVTYKYEFNTKNNLILAKNFRIVNDDEDQNGIIDTYDSDPPVYDFLNGSWIATEYIDKDGRDMLNGFSFTQQQTLCDGSCIIDLTWNVKYENFNVIFNGGNVTMNYDIIMDYPSYTCSPCEAIPPDGFWDTSDQDIRYATCTYNSTQMTLNGFLLAYGGELFNPTIIEYTENFLHLQEGTAVLKMQRIN